MTTDIVRSEDSCAAAGWRGRRSCGTRTRGVQARRVSFGFGWRGTVAVCRGRARFGSCALVSWVERGTGGGTYGAYSSAAEGAQHFILDNGRWAVSLRWEDLVSHPLPWPASGRGASSIGGRGACGRGYRVRRPSGASPSYGVCSGRRKCWPCQATRCGCVCGRSRFGACNTFVSALLRPCSSSSSPHSCYSKSIAVPRSPGIAAPCPPIFRHVSIFFATY
ncbi:hypothetical protein B0H13DRAFT_2116349 [Mycena leptocephala]|nr:hypothetical protein B0H13DRAFT_2116349 [Mycena leptocephala]